MARERRWARIYFKSLRSSCDKKPPAPANYEGEKVDSEPEVSDDLVVVCFHPGLRDDGGDAAGDCFSFNKLVPGTKFTATHDNLLLPSNVTPLDDKLKPGAIAMLDQACVVELFRDVRAKAITNKMNTSRSTTRRSAVSGDWTTALLVVGTVSAKLTGDPLIQLLWQLKDCAKQLGTNFL